MAWYSMAGVECIGTDIDQKKIDAINRGELPAVGIEPLLPQGLFDKDLVTATTNWEELIHDEEISAYFIAVPTEKGGEPWWAPLEDVMEKLSPRRDCPLIIIESTLAVGTVDKVVPLHLKEGVAVCPRRDWFVGSKTVKTIPRIVGGVTEEATRRAVETLSIICDATVPMSYKEAELVKAYENAYLHVLYVLAQEMALSYPNTDIREVLKFAGTKWNIESLFPNVWGTGGYCVPISSKYVIEGAENPEELRLLRDTLKRDNSIAGIFQGLNRFDRIGCLGLSYIQDVKVHILSPLIRLLRYVDGAKIMVHDPLYSQEEIKVITGCSAFVFPDDLDQFDVVLLLCGH